MPWEDMYGRCRPCSSCSLFNILFYGHNFVDPQAMFDAQETPPKRHIVLMTLRYRWAVGLSFRDGEIADAKCLAAVADGSKLKVR